MATTTYVPLISYTVPSAVSSVTLGSGGQGTIPSTYTDLVLVANLRSDDGSTTINNRFRLGNGGTIDTGTNYSMTRLNGNGTSATSSRTSNTDAIDIYADASGSAFNPTIIQIMNYSNSTTYKTVISRYNGNANTGASVGLWRSTSAVDCIRLQAGNGKWVSGSTFTLYGIANADTGALATGGVITYDSTYYYHTFGSSGTFTPKQNLTVDYLVVAGGGGGGNLIGGGGGAGGLLSTVDNYGGPSGSLQSKLSLTSSTAYTITVGSGGAGVPTGTHGQGSDGGSSSIAGSGLTTISTTGGGGGARGASGDQSTEVGRSGGSGGGAGGSGGSNTKTGGAGTANQGYAGGNGVTGNPNAAGGGGGGAGAVGGSGSGATSGVGGNGVAISSMANATGTGVLTYYAGGGGGGSQTGNGGAGGSGGGGAGGNLGNNPGNPGTVNTGGGGGSSGYIADGNKPAGGNGGSGIVIIRYPKA